MCYCAATNVGVSLYVERFDWEILFIDCPTGIEFITGDQPVVNILGNKDGGPVEHFALYYPLSPNLAMNLAPKSLQFSSALNKLDLAKTNELNHLIAWDSSEFLISKSPG